MIIDFAVKTQNENYGSLSSFNKINDTAEDKSSDSSFKKVFEKITGSSRDPESNNEKAVKNSEKNNEIPADMEKTKSKENKDGKEIKDSRAGKVNTQNKNPEGKEKLINADSAKEPVKGVADNQKEITPELEKFLNSKIKKSGSGVENKDADIAAGSKDRIKDKTDAAADDNEILSKINDGKKLSADSNNSIKDLPDNQVSSRLSDVKKNEIKLENFAGLLKTVKKSDSSEKPEEKSDKKDVKKEIFRILDLRTRRSENIENNIAVNKSAGGESSLESSDSISNIKFSTDAVSKEAFLNARSWSEPGAFIKSEQTPLQNQVLENLRNHGNSEIIRNAQILLKDNDSGEIKLLMKPDNLGFVRIKLTVEDNNIAGRIIVDNYNVKELFESNLENLLRNFRESGYSTATLDVSVGGGKGEKEGMNNGTRNFAKKIIKDVEEHSLIKNSSYDRRLVDLVI